MKDWALPAQKPSLAVPRTGALVVVCTSCCGSTEKEGFTQHRESEGPSS